ncbi:hypothetical protein PUW24_18805 [Paenibacillus urinalis]|uniref:Uncharacterized protein n=1 Tax=Paenibacillus urinalis TaxID=521520 RepID=A0ABY7XHV5_9BACL|nr:hypothetical protein [Paenibacillus urinalis]WDH96212.1 hypothetical protein PUW24_18805 [Paenibacillus urinalis]WDI04435.1 hypothetical protein PUW25_10970 [Paenibacillus urinalis]
MWRNPKNKDEQIQDYISRQVRAWNHAHGLKKVMNKAAGAIAAALARLFIRDRGTAQISYLSGGCFPPHGQLCRDCGSDGACPSTYVTCTTYNALMGCRGLCPHPSGWWYTSDPVGFRSKCTDCVSQHVKPYTPGNWCYQGARINGEYVICGCQSTLLY